MPTFAKRVILCVVAGCLAGCATLPAAGPSSTDVLGEGHPPHAQAPRFLVAELTPGTAAVLDSYPRPTFTRFGGQGPAPASTLGIGDAVQVTIWEAASGGLFSSESVAGVTAGSHSAIIPEQIVSRDGAITVPYAGSLPVAGKTPHQVEVLVVKRLADKAIQPQALVTMVKNASNTATVLGEVQSASRVPLSLRGDRILDAIASAGGIRSPIHELFVALSRGSTTVRMPLQVLVTRPSENIYVLPNDILTLIREPQTFTVFGATGRNAQVPFEATGLTLEEAVAKAGGLMEFLSDAAGVFVMRAEPVDIARKLDPAFPIPPRSTTINVVYHVNLKDPNTFFVARRFQMRNKDMIYIATSQSTEILKALSVFSAATSPALSGAYLVR